MKFCLNCGKEIPIIKSRDQNKKYCCLSCVYEYRRKVSLSLRTNRKKAIKRAGNKCEICGRSDLILHAHHKKKAIYGKGHSATNKNDNSLSNLLVLCIKCHRQNHSKGIKRFTGNAICMNCGKNFKYYPKSNYGKYCSKECMYQTAKERVVRVKKICSFCNKEYNGIKKSKFCSVKCKSKDFYKKYGRKKNQTTNRKAE